MRELSNREKRLIGILAVLVVFAVGWLAKDNLNLDLLGRGLKTKQAHLAETKALISLSKSADQTKQSLRQQTGLHGRVISDTLAAEIERLDLLQQLNQAKRSGDLAKLHPAFREKAGYLIDFRQQNEGEIDNVDQLKEIEGPIFVGEQPEAVIAQQISTVSRSAGLKSNYQLSIKAQPGKKSAQINTEAKTVLKAQLYLSALDKELAELEAEQDRLAEEAEGAMGSMFDIWNMDGESDSAEDVLSTEDDAEGGTDGSNAAAVYSDREESKSDVTSSAIEETSSTNGFKQLPISIPLDARVELIYFIKAEIEQDFRQISGRPDGLIAAQLNSRRTDTNGGFPFKENSILLEECGILLEDYGSEDGSIEEIELANQASIQDFADYLNHTYRRQKEIQQILVKVPITYQPQHYTVSMKFQGQINQASNFIYAVENQLRWLQVRDLKIVIADKKKNLLGFNLMLVANIL